MYINHQPDASIANSRCDATCGCHSASPVPLGFTRRDFLAAASAAAATSLFSDALRRAVAGPFSADDFRNLIPEDKKLDPAWVRSLFERGRPAVYRGDELTKIGMPVGGICTGQLYLGGDGRLWLWDIFNLPATSEFRDTGGGHYAKPLRPFSPIEQGFALQIKMGDDLRTRRLDSDGFNDIAFTGQYPIARVTYAEPLLPVRVELEAFSPFIPLNEDDSGLPATILEYTVRNTGEAPLEVSLAGWLENAASLRSGRPRLGSRRNRLVRGDGVTRLDCDAVPTPQEERNRPPARPDIVFDDFERDGYERWSTVGTAFGDGPRAVKDLPEYMGKFNQQGERVVNTHNTRGGEDVAAADQHLGVLTSKPFKIERDFINFRIGGGAHVDRTCVNLLVDGQVVRTATGRNANRMYFEAFDVRAFRGRVGVLQVVDLVTGGWGQIAIDDIIFSDRPRYEPGELDEQPDWGTMSLALMGAADGLFANTQAAGGPWPAAAFESDSAKFQSRDASKPFEEKLFGVIGRRATLAPGESAKFTFVLAWHFDGLWWDSLDFIPDVRQRRRHYGTRFKSAAEVVEYIRQNYDRIAGQTRLWRDTWYDSTLPHWFLDRTLSTASTLATSTCYRFDNNRFYAWEGTYCCAGTCTHVWQYAHAVARLFPRLERSLREMVDFGLAFHDETGAIDYRGEAAKSVAHDGQCGNILRAYREHLMAPDGAFLRDKWPRIRKATEYLIARDENEDGLLEGEQYNTLDTSWYGPMAWMSSLYLAAVRAGQAMADELGDAGFAERCERIVERGNKNLVERLFNGEYFIHIPDAKHPETNSTNDGCHTDQLLGQSWAHQVGLGRIVPYEQTVAALRSMWKYCFTPDVGVYRDGFKPIKGGRWFAMPGEGGLVLCTFPKGGGERAVGKGRDAWAASYFNECWTGFEYQVAALMLWESFPLPLGEGQGEGLHAKHASIARTSPNLSTAALAICRMIHDRYHPALRNPYNEVECSDHYARAMASYGVFLAACGFECHGPRGHIAFAPRLTPHNFRAAFTAPEGWGTFSQVRVANSQSARIDLRHGRLRLRTCGLELRAAGESVEVTASTNGTPIKPSVQTDGTRLTLRFKPDIVLSAPGSLEVTIRY